jgi:hypothetical protein
MNKLCNKKSKKKSLIEMSSAVAEFIAISEPLRLVKGVMNLMLELEIVVEKPVKIFN